MRRQWAMHGDGTDRFECGLQQEISVTAYDSPEAEQPRGRLSWDDHDRSVGDGQ